jgi:hypothetical protein
MSVPSAFRNTPDTESMMPVTTEASQLTMPSNIQLSMSLTSPSY